MILISWSLSYCVSERLLSKKILWAKTIFGSVRNLICNNLICRLLPYYDWWELFGWSCFGSLPRSSWGSSPGSSAHDWKERWHQQLFTQTKILESNSQKQTFSNKARSHIFNFKLKLYYNIWVIQRTWMMSFLCNKTYRLNLLCYSSA